MPRPLPLRLGLALVALVVAALLAGCGVLDTSSGASTATPDDGAASSPGAPIRSRSADLSPPREPAAAPEVGECRVLSYADIGRFSNSSSTVRCDRPHTGYTFAVAQLPKDIAFEGVDIGNDAVQDAAAGLCRTAFASYVGGSAATHRLSRLSSTYFLPGQTDFDLGARWVRCDAIALQSERVLADLPGRLEGFNDSDAALADYGLCARGEPGTRDGVLVMCNQKHTFRALTALRLGAEDAAYPGDNVVADGGQQRCDDFISRTLGLGGGYSYTWTYPSRDDWANGQRFGFCWMKSSAD